MVSPGFALFRGGWQAAGHEENRILDFGLGGGFGGGGLRGAVAGGWAVAIVFYELSGGLFAAAAAGG